MRTSLCRPAGCSSIWLLRRTARYSSSLRVVAINDVYELHALPRLKSLINERKPQIVSLAGDFLSPSILSGMDQGSSMIATLNCLPVTHACFGNHEADFQLEDVALRISEFGGCWINSNVPGFNEAYASASRRLGGPEGFKPQLPLWDVVEVGPYRIGVLGLLTSERGIFRKDKMRGLAIEPVGAMAERLAALLRSEHGATHVIALTHQTVGADVELAKSGSVDLILGGHDHEVMEVRPEGGAPIIKSGSDAKIAAVLDIELGPSRALTASVAFEPVEGFAADPEVQAEVDSHLAVIRALEKEPMCSLKDSEVLERQQAALSSKRTRFEQTTVGALLTSCVRDCLGTEVAMINGGTIKGNVEYPDGKISYLQLKQELPFPTKMVVVQMPGATLRDAVLASRLPTEEAPSEENRAFLQLDDSVEVRIGEGGVMAGEIRIGGKPLEPSASYSVALPRNLMKGAFKILPLVEFGKLHAEELPDEDNFLPALNVVVMHQAKRMWRRLGSFEALDLDGETAASRRARSVSSVSPHVGPSTGDGEISEGEIRIALRQALGAEPSPFLVSNVLRTLDLDESGCISRDEFATIDQSPMPGG